MGPKRKKAETVESVPTQTGSKRAAKGTTTTRGKTQPDKARKLRASRDQNGQSSPAVSQSGGDDTSPVVTRRARSKADASKPSDALPEGKKSSRGSAELTVAGKRDKRSNVAAQKGPVIRGRRGISEHEILKEIDKSDIKAGVKRKKFQRLEDIEGSPAKRPALDRSAAKVSVEKSCRTEKKGEVTSKGSSACAAPSHRVPETTKVEKTTRFSALPGKVTTLSTNLSKLKRDQRLQAKKSLCSKDILNLLNDFDPEVVEDESPDPEEVDDVPDKIEEQSKNCPAKRPKETVMKPATTKSSRVIRKSPRKSAVNTSSMANKSSESMIHVPIWKKPGNHSKVVVDPKECKADVFDMACYGEEEFGPEKDEGVKKKTRRRKKNTKAILVFGNQSARQEIEKAIKQTHNLNTPSDKRKVKNLPKILVTGPPVAAPASRPAHSVLGYSSDFSTGAHNYFDSVHGQQHFELSAGPDHSVAENTDAEQPTGQPTATYKTPSIPKKISKFLQNNQSSTPKLETVKPSKHKTTKEQIKNAFGFDDTDEEELSGSESMLISPVKRVPGRGDASILEESNRNPSILRETELQSFRDNLDADKKITGPYRFNAPVVRNPILQQLKLLERQKADASIAKQIRQPKHRTSPRKKKMPSAASTEPTVQAPAAVVDPPTSSACTAPDCERLSQPAGSPQSSPQKVPKNAFEVMKARQAQPVTKAKKLTKKASKSRKQVQPSLSESSASSLVNKINGTGGSRTKLSGRGKISSTKKFSGKENSSSGNTSQDSLDSTRPIVVNTYRRKNSTQHVSFETSITSPKKRLTKKDKKVEEWAKLQTSHFSEVEEFDLSFA